MLHVSLSSTDWSFRDSANKNWMPAKVPGCVHTDLRRAGRIPDPFWSTNELDLQWIEERDWEYRTTFTASEALFEYDVIELVADGLDTVATVVLNGKVIGSGENMFEAYRWDVRRQLRRGRNELVVRFQSAKRYLRTHRTDLDPGEINDPLRRAPAIRKQQCQFGWDWGPRFVTAGIWRDIRLEAWSGNRVTGIRVVQKHARDGSVTLSIGADTVHPDRRTSVRGTVSLDGRLSASVEAGAARIEKAALWWPNGQGAQPLYTVNLQVVGGDGKVIGRWARRIGLRTIELDRHRDAAGETFQFVVNGRPIFAKGANWIPAHSFVAGLTRDDYARDLRSAAAANMNMLRVWGGGIYESEDFYDLCDELGLLVWQDFMFACSIYPADREFVASVRREAEHQVRRLRHRACLALWCGNNEVEHLNRVRLQKPALKADYARLFEQTLPKVVARHDGATAYWPSSPHRPGGDTSHAAGDARGDSHFWDVWHARNPVKDYEKWRFRFCSEFGMQSYSSPETNATFCPADDRNIFGPSMENHQKNRGGNQVILDYVSRRYRLPRTQDDLIYLSQLNQAHCMQVGVEHYRRNMPHCMGALYWQLNDCWPVASWSSLEHTGRWRALHHIARRFFAPVLVSAHVPGDETTGVGNYRQSTISVVHLHTVSDLPTPTEGVLRWDLFDVTGRRVLHGRQDVVLRYGESICQRTLDLAQPIARFGRDRLVLRIAIDVGGERATEETVFLAPPRFVPLPKAKPEIVWRQLSPTRIELTFRSRVFLHRFSFGFGPLEHRPDDNFFELYPGESKTVRVELGRANTLGRLKRALTCRSLADTY